MRKLLLTLVCVVCLLTTGQMNQTIVIAFPTTQVNDYPDITFWFSGEGCGSDPCGGTLDFYYLTDEDYPTGVPATPVGVAVGRAPYSGAPTPYMSYPIISALATDFMSAGALNGNYSIETATVNETTVQTSYFRFQNTTNNLFVTENSDKGRIAAWVNFYNPSYNDEIVRLYIGGTAYFDLRVGSGDKMQALFPTGSSTVQCTSTTVSAATNYLIEVAYDTTSTTTTDTAEILINGVSCFSSTGLNLLPIRNTTPEPDQLPSFVAVGQYSTPSSPWYAPMKIEFVAFSTDKDRDFWDLVAGTCDDPPGTRCLSDADCNTTCDAGAPITVYNGLP